MFVVRRSQETPVIRPSSHMPWMGVGAFNGCPVMDTHGTTHVVFRALAKADPVIEGPKEVSSIGYARSPDGIHFDAYRQLIVPTEPYERFGCEDPRVTFFEGTYYIFYTAISEFPVNTPSGIKVALATTKDFKKIKKHGVITPFSCKAMALFPERVQGKITVILTADPEVNPKKIAIAQLDTIDQLTNQDSWQQWYDHVEDHRLHGIERSGTDQIEVGAPPIKTDTGWLCIYSHIENHEGHAKDYQYVYGIEALLLDLEQPTNILGKTSGPMLAPTRDFERQGVVRDVVFPSGALVRGDMVEIFYGGADTVCAKAEVRLRDLVHTLYPTTASDHRIARVSDAPLLVPDPAHGWEAKAVFNPGAVDIDGTAHIFYRAMGHDDTSVIGLALSHDGTTVRERLPEPVYVPRADFEQKKRPGNSGCEDPRVTIIGDRLYMLYTAFDAINPPQVAATSIALADVKKRNWNWTQPVVVSPASFDDKDACLYPDTVQGKYVFLHRIGGTICFDYFDTLDFAHEKADRCHFVLGSRMGMWDTWKVGLAGPPHKTADGWLMFYHGVSNRTHSYRVGAALFALDDPAHLLGRTTDVLFKPELQWEKEGIVPNVVFPCGSVIRSAGGRNTAYIYYGGADTVVGVATVDVDTLLQALRP